MVDRQNQSLSALRIIDAAKFLLQALINSDVQLKGKMRLKDAELQEKSCLCVFGM